MPSNLVVYDYNGIAKIPFSKKGYVNATQMAKPFGKRPDTFLRLKSTKRFVEALKSFKSNDAQNLSITNYQRPYITYKGRSATEQGTWMVNELAIKYAEYLDPPFGIWTSQRIIELLSTGKTELIQKSDEVILAESMVIAHKIIEKNKQTIQALLPKAESHDALMDTTGLFTMAQAADTIQIPHPTRKGIMGSVLLYDLLRKDNIVGNRGRYHNVARVQYINQGYFELKLVKSPYGHSHTQTLVTPKGIEWLRKRYASKTLRKVA